MWSASSITLISTSPSWQWPCSMRSASRPGQATTISVRARRAATCRLWGVPPKTVTTVSPTAWASGARTACTWLASSRVGTSTRPRGRQAMVWPSAKAVTSGMENAIVLPEPVRPRPSTSRPASASGSVAAWIGNGVVIPTSASTLTTGAGTPRDAKLTARAAGMARRPRRPRWAALEFSMGRTVKGMSFGLGWPHCLGPPRPWKPVRSPSDVRPARPDGCASLRTVLRQLYRRSALAPKQRPDRPAPAGGIAPAVSDTGTAGIGNVWGRRAGPKLEADGNGQRFHGGAAAGGRCTL